VVRQQLWNFRGKRRVFLFGHGLFVSYFVTDRSRVTLWLCAHWRDQSIWPQEVPWWCGNAGEKAPRRLRADAVVAACFLANDANHQYALIRVGVCFLCWPLMPVTTDLKLANAPSIVSFCIFFRILHFLLTELKLCPAIRRGLSYLNYKILKFPWNVLEAEIQSKLIQFLFF